MAVWQKLFAVGAALAALLAAAMACASEPTAPTVEPSPSPTIVEIAVVTPAPASSPAATEAPAAATGKLSLWAPLKLVARACHGEPSVFSRLSWPRVSHARSNLAKVILS